MSKGSRYNENKLRWRNFPLFLIEELIKVGAKAEKYEGNPNGKYPTYNFLEGLGINDSLDSLKRHLMKLESPYHSDFDEESGINHAYHIAWNALIIGHFLKHRPDLDDRYKDPRLDPNIRKVRPSELTPEERKELVKITVEDVISKHKELLSSPIMDDDYEKIIKETSRLIKENTYIKGNE